MCALPVDWRVLMHAAPPDTLILPPVSPSFPSFLSHLFHQSLKKPVTYAMIHILHLPQYIPSVSSRFTFFFLLVHVCYLRRFLTANVSHHLEAIL